VKPESAMRIPVVDDERSKGDILCVAQTQIAKVRTLSQIATGKLKDEVVKPESRRNSSSGSTTLQFHLGRGKSAPVLHKCN
jgi:hypothetical protein